MSVSVAIATYNRAAMVRQAVESALAGDEIVVSDDASDDDTQTVLEDLRARHRQVRIFRREDNSRGVENWNFAIRQTSGDYIAWCSDDDRFLAEHLEQSVAFLKSNPQVGFVHSGFLDAIEAGGVSTVEPRPLRFRQTRILTRATLVPYLIRYYDWPFHPSTIVMRREVWETVGGFDARWSLADTDWFARAVERYPAAMLPVHGVLNRRHPGNWSNRMGSVRMQAEIREIVERAIGRIYDSPWKRAFWRAVWRANVRLHLALTLRARVRSGHADAACAAWEALLGPSHGWLKLAGVLWFRHRCRQHGGWLNKIRDAKEGRQSVSPL